MVLFALQSERSARLLSNSSPVVDGFCTAPHPQYIGGSGRVDIFALPYATAAPL